MEDAFRKYDMEETINSYLRESAMRNADVAFKESMIRLNTRSDFLGINSCRLAHVVMGNRRGAEQVLRLLAAKAEAATTLPELMAIHKDVYKVLQGIDCPIQLEHLGPDMYGMFRTATIAGLNMDNCYLGNVSGLWTQTARQWERIRDSDPKAYGTVRSQYAGMIASNARAAARIVQQETRQDVRQRHRSR